MWQAIWRTSGIAALKNSLMCAASACTAKWLVSNVAERGPKAFEHDDLGCLKSTMYLYQGLLASLVLGVSVHGSRACWSMFRLNTQQDNRYGLQAAYIDRVKTSNDVDSVCNLYSQQNCFGTPVDSASSRSASWPAARMGSHRHLIRGGLQSAKPPQEKNILLPVAA